MKTYVRLKGLGHAILGNFSTDQIVIELTKIWKERFKTIEELKQNTGKPRRGIDGQNWRGLNGLHLGKFEKRRPTFFQIYVSLYQNIITQRENHSQLLCGLDFANERVYLLCQFDV